MKKLLIYILLVSAPIYGTHPKREFRGVWIATVFNIDWPSKKGLSPEIQKQELIKHLDSLQDMKMNAAILQIKPTSDSFYRSKLSPWSRYLTGTQGKDPLYDPLAFFIEEAQKRALETHVWINPFRILNGEPFDSLDKNHIARKNPDWVINYDGRYYFDPGNPNVQAYIQKEVLEIVRNYDIDVIHMDDYFYPYKVFKNNQLVPFNDKKSWEKYGKNKFKSKDDWRRNNTDMFVKNMSEAIKKEKSHIKFGISPFGIWRNQDNDPRGSKTKSGQTNYDDLFADILKWIENKWIDYVAPQIYWDFTTKNAEFDMLVDWWANAVKNQVDLYIGIGVYKLHEQQWPLSSIKKQVEYIRKKDAVDGVIYYSSKWMLNNTKGIKQDIISNIHPYPTLIPTKAALKAPQAPINFKETVSNNKRILTWDTRDQTNIRYFVIYEFPDTETVDITNPRYILTKIPADIRNFEIEFKTNYNYGITAVSRMHHESELTINNRTENDGLTELDNILDSIIQ